MDTEDTLDIAIGNDEITLKRYPFLERNTGRIVRADALTEITVGWAPPCVRTLDGEFIFLPAQMVEPLARFGLTHDIPFLSRTDIWSMILDPFLDTTHDEDYLEKAMSIMVGSGVSREAVWEMRKLVGTRMRILTYRTWEWVYYGLYDVLDQMRTLTFTTGWAFDRFYDHAMALANRGETGPATPDEFRRTFIVDTD